MVPLDSMTGPAMKPIRISSFSSNGTGGNPAGVVIADALPTARDMQQIAADLGYSETAFAIPEGDDWRVRYYAPMGEVAFCGHATIALGAALGQAHGAGRYTLNLRDAVISVEAMQAGDNWSAALQSPQTWSKPLPQDILVTLLRLFGLSPRDLDPALAPTLAFAGVRHAILTLGDRGVLSEMTYPFGPMRDLMAAHDLVTVSLLHITAPRRFPRAMPLPAEVWSKTPRRALPPRPWVVRWSILIGTGCDGAAGSPSGRAKTWAPHPI